MEEAKRRALPVAALADAVDRLGLRSQTMRSEMRPVYVDSPVLGPAFTIQAVPTPTLTASPYEKELDAVDAIPAGAVVVFSTGGATEAGIWGELLSVRALARGCAGAIVDGSVRDLRGMRSLRFPVFASGIHPSDSYGRAEVVSFGAPIVCSGVAVRPGDLVAADEDGVGVIPTEVAGECVAAAAEKVDKELEAGRMLRDDGASIREMYARHEIL